MSAGCAGPASTLWAWCTRAIWKTQRPASVIGDTHDNSFRSCAPALKYRTVVEATHYRYTEQNPGQRPTHKKQLTATLSPNPSYAVSSNYGPRPEYVVITERGAIPAGARRGSFRCAPCRHGHGVNQKTRYLPTRGVPRVRPFTSLVLSRAGNGGSGIGRSLRRCAECGDHSCEAFKPIPRLTPQAQPGLGGRPNQSLRGSERAIARRSDSEEREMLASEARNIEVVRRYFDGCN